MAVGAEVTSAATLVAALLEHQGLLTQARILDSFTGFFRDAGALVFLLSGIGAVVSVLLYGSFRAPRYLIIGPALFWFLVGPRAENVDGAVWQLGGGEERGLRGEANASRDIRDKVLEKLNQNVDATPDIAQGFWLFIKPINDFTNEMVDVILNDEDQRDLVVSSRIYGLELIASMQPNDADYMIRAEQGFMLNCQQTMAEATAAGAALVKHRVGTGATEQSAALTKLVNEHTTEMLRYAELERVPTRHSGFGELIRAHKNRQGGSTLARSLLNGEEPRSEISCKQAWHLLAEESWHLAAKGMARVLRISSNALDVEKLKETVCGDLTRKAVAESDDGSCNIQPAVTLALLNNHITKPHTFNRVFARHWNNQEHTNPTKHVQLTSGGHGYKPVMQNGRYMMRWSEGDTLGRANPEILMRKSIVGANGETQNLEMWSGVMEMNQDYGLNDAMWVSTRQYEIVNLRQRIYSYAINLPYYQGMLLFLIAISYPFFALLVIVPGKASAFLNIPLAWLWVKSWDIGFAAIITLDKVLFNLLPSANIAEPLRKGPWTDISQLPLVLSEGFNFDPMGSIHNYYSIISFVWFAVPVITGFITLKSKRGVLSMFSDAAENLSRESGNAAAQGFSLTAQDKRNTMLREMQGFARRLPTLGSNGVESGYAGQSARLTAGMRALASTTSNVSPDKVLKGDISELSKLLGGAETYNNTKKNLAIAESEFQSELLRSFDPAVGRWGTLGILHGSYTAAMDGGGGYELYDHDANITNALIGKYKANFGVALDSLSDASAGFSRRLSTFYDNPLATGGMAYFMTSMNLAALGKDEGSIRDLRLAAGAYGISDEAFATMFLNQHPSIAGSSGLNGQMGEYGFASSYFGTIAPSHIPGGYSGYIDAMLSTTGGEYRLVGNNTAVEGPSGTPGQILATATTGFGTIAGQFNHNGAQNNGLPGTGVSNFEQVLSADSQLKAQSPDVYREAVDHKTNVLAKYFGQDNIEAYITSTGQTWSGSATPQQVLAYAKHEDAKPTDHSPFELDSRFSLNTPNMLAALDDVRMWATARDNLTVGHDYGLRTLPGTVANQGFQLWANPYSKELNSND